jgi:hypothetical protein
MSLKTLTAQHRADLQELTGLAANDLTLIWNQLGSAASLAEMMDILTDLVAIYGSAAATLGAEWYEEIREASEVSGRFSAIAVDLAEPARTYALAGWGVSLLAKDPDTALVRVTGGLQRIIADADRQSVAMSSINDPRADGWQRQGSGDCGFCSMLIGRGSVFTESTADFASHDHCKCVAVPAFGGTERLVKPYTPSPRQASDADRARVRAYLKANP